MKVLQLIDSLEPGGAERVAVEYANLLSKHIAGSYLCTTRAEGALLTTMQPEVKYLFLKRTRTLDYGAFKRLYAYVLNEKIDCIHAHGSSYFLATLIKMRRPSVVVIWHNHLGASTALAGIKLKVLRYCSSYFDVIINVNKELVYWANTKLKCKKVVYLPNFVNFEQQYKGKLPEVSGEKGKRIVCLANLKNPKGHHFLMESFLILQREVPEATLHLIGRDFKDVYSDKIKRFITNNDLHTNVFIYGLLSVPESIVEQCDIGVLASSSEGLPMALLEYGKAKLAVVVTNVGYCPEVVQDYGTFVSYGDTDAMSKALQVYCVNAKKAKQDSVRFKKHIEENFSESQVINSIIDLYKDTIE
ncbi:glycosyltransferase family 4 protein [Dokdonia ponticola]|uniref:Glycosyltransferase family 4 protein n=1 Tax=Dokdonia ponticola TaxID=2041041 RepID=A0ABV9I1L9_9FLAO